MDTETLVIHIEGNGGASSGIASINSRVMSSEIYRLNNRLASIALLLDRYIAWWFSRFWALLYSSCHSETKEKCVRERERERDREREGERQEEKMSNSSLSWAIRADASRPRQPPRIALPLVSGATGFCSWCSCSCKPPTCSRTRHSSLTLSALPRGIDPPRRRSPLAKGETETSSAIEILQAKARESSPTTTMETKILREKERERERREDSRNCIGRKGKGGVY